jgi:hypothetical protein
MNLRAAAILCLVTACGADTKESPGQERTADTQGKTATAEEAELRRDPVNLCERGCTWLEACCVETGQCLPSDCRGDCIATLKSSGSESCLELGSAIVDCLTATSCNQIDMGLAPLCVTENREFAEQGCQRSNEESLIQGVVGEDAP